MVGHRDLLAVVPVEQRMRKEPIGTLANVLGRTIHGLTNRLRYRFRPRLKNPEQYISHVTGRHGLEIGGPSAVFRDERFIPLYKHVGRLDGVNFGTTTVWEGAIREGQTYKYLASREEGVQFILEATDLWRIASGRYDFVLSSHSLEHTANPIKALREWSRVMKADGVLLLVVPHKERTFDHLRPTTGLQHLISDYTNDTGESDLSHLPEILAYHDLTMDPPAGDLAAFRTRCLNNVENRCLHHHVFDLRTALALVDYAGFQLLRADTVRPYHIVVLARKAASPDNRAFLTPVSDVFANSCFRTDRQFVPHGLEP